MRVDSGVVEGMDVPRHYDPMVAKLICWGVDRDAAMERTRRALQDYLVVGIPTSIPFFLAILDDPDFRAGNYSTAFIRPDWLEAHVRPDPDVEETSLIAAAIAKFESDKKALPAEDAVSEGSGWKRGLRWSERARVRP